MKITFVVVVTTAFCFVLHKRAINELQDFLKEKNLFNEFYSDE